MKNCLFFLLLFTAACGGTGSILHQVPGTGDNLSDKDSGGKTDGEKKKDDEVTPKLGGEQTNTLIKFQFPAHHVEGEYDSRLTPTVLTEKQILFTDQASVLDISIIEAIPADDLQEIAEEQWARVMIHELPGFQKEEILTDGTTQSITYLALQSGAFILIKMKSSDSQTAELFAAVVHSVHSDFTGPVIHSIQAAASYRAGESLELNVEITDDFSGVDVKRIHIEVASAENGVDFSSGDIALVPADHDHYTITFPLNAYLPSGHYHIASCSVWDKAGNQTLIQGGTSGCTADFEIQNASGIVDQAAPIFKILVGPSGSKETKYIVIGAEIDDLSSLKLSGSTRFVHRDALENSNPPKSQMFTAKNITRNPGTNRYEIGFSLPAGLAEGTYVLESIGVTDDLGLSTQVRLVGSQYRVVGGNEMKIASLPRGPLTFDVKRSSASEDTTAPKITSVSAQNSTIQSGENILVNVVTKDESEIRDIRAELVSLDDPDYADGNNSGNADILHLPLSNWTAIGFDTYRLVFRTNEFIRGRYRLSALSVADEVGNVASLPDLPLVDISIE